MEMAKYSSTWGEYPELLRCNQYGCHAVWVRNGSITSNSHLIGVVSGNDRNIQSRCYCLCAVYAFSIKRVLSHENQNVFRISKPRLD